MQPRDHHDWGSDAYVDEWVKRQQSEDPARAARFQLMCDRFPFPSHASVTILDVGAGYGPVSTFILDRYPNATCIGQDGSVPMLERARTLMARYGERFRPHQSDLFARDWLPARLGSFDAAISAICLHNLRDFKRIGEIYGEVRGRLKAGGVFLNLDLVNAPDGTGPFPATLAQQLAALKAAGYERVDCFWQDERRALFGGYA
jgi:SAM-dependent methyltransferase